MEIHLDDLTDDVKQLFIDLNMKPTEENIKIIKEYHLKMGIKMKDIIIDMINNEFN